jgi:hypothetical protein
VLDERQMVNVGQAAALAKMSRRRFHEYLAAGTGPASVTVAGNRCFDRRVVLAWDRERRGKLKRRRGA